MVALNDNLQKMAVKRCSVVNQIDTDDYDNNRICRVSSLFSNSFHV